MGILTTTNLTMLQSCEINLTSPMVSNIHTHTHTHTLNDTVSLQRSKNVKENTPKDTFLIATWSKLIFLSLR